MERRLRWSPWTWTTYITAAVLAVSATAVMMAVVAPNPFTARIFFSSVDDRLSKSPLSSLNPKISTVIASPPPSLAPSPSFVRDFGSSGAESRAGDLKNPIISSVATSPAPPPAENSDANEVNSSSDDLGLPPLQSENPISSAAMTSQPPFHAPLPSPKASPLQVELPGTSTVMTSPPPVQKSDVNDVKSEMPISLMKAVDKELIFAKQEIDRAPIVSDDPDLYAPLFRNVSVFKRSYELMESTLKVYIYQDGQRPIFHTPALKGIYASEGWFMKLMEGNRKFVVKDPNKAHLFYLPYSARQLQLAIFRPDSHNVKPLAVFLKNYVDGISAKYPFWNRTRGADHFLVACHDWGPYTTRLHEELSKNTIRALCNADLGEGFVVGKDVSLPETTIGNPKHPLKDLGGKPVSQRSILAFFAGQMHGRVRPILLDYWSGKDEDMKIYSALPHQLSRKMSYIQHMKSSKFCICPMGYEVNSPRIVEAIYYECVPVIIADNFVLPFDQVLDWSAFSVVVAEKDIPKLKDILLGISLRKYVSMQKNVRRLQKHFLWHPRPVKYDIFHMILHSIWFNRLNQIQVHQ